MEPRGIGLIGQRSVLEHGVEGDSSSLLDLLHIVWGDKLPLNWEGGVGMG